MTTLHAVALLLALVAVDDAGEIATAPVELDGAVLLRVRGVSSLSADARASVIHDRLVAVASDPRIPVEAIRLVDEGGGARIVAGDRPILTVLDADADLEQIGRGELAAAHRQRLQTAIAEYRRARSGAALRRDGLSALLDTILLAAALLTWRRLCRAADGFVARRLEEQMHSVEARLHGVMRAEGMLGALHSVIQVLRVAGSAAIVLVYLDSVLGRFPWTRPMSQDVARFALGPLQVLGLGLLANIPRLMFLVVLFLVLRVALRLIRLLFESVDRGTVTLTGFEREWAQPTYKIVRAAVIAFGIVVAYPYVPGSESAAFKGVSLFAGVVFSLGSSTAVANLIAGYMMTYRRAFRVGDRIRIGDTRGEVIETRIQVTRIRTPKNEEVVIPNSLILTGQVINYSSLAATRGLILHTRVSVGYDRSWQQVEAMLLAGAARTRGICKDPPPFVLEKELGQFAVTYELNVYCRDATAMFETYAALHRHVLDVFNEHDIQIMVPAYEGDPAAPKVPPRSDGVSQPPGGMQ